MTYIKASKSILSNAKTLSEEAKEFIKNANTNISRYKSEAATSSANWEDNYWSKHKNKASVSRSSYERTTTYTKADGTTGTTTTFDQNGYNSEVERQARAWVRGQRNTYLGRREYMESYLPDCQSPIAAVYRSLSNIILAIEDFESVQPSIKEEMKNLDTMSSVGKFVYESVKVKLSNGVEQVVEELRFSVDGEKPAVSIAEIVNCEVSTVLTTASSAVVVASVATEQGLTDEERKAYFEEHLVSTVSNSIKANETNLEKGFYSVVSSEGIAAMYTDAMGKEYDAEEVKTEYTNLAAYYSQYDEFLNCSTNAGEFGSMAMAGSIMAAITMNGMLPDDLKTIEKDDEEEPVTTVNYQQYMSSAPADTQVSEPEVLVEPEVVEPILPDPIESEPTETIPDDSPVDDHPVDDNPVDDNPPVSEDPTPEPEKPTVSDEVAEGVREQIADLADEETPDIVEKELVTSEDIDNQARDEYYASKTEEQLYSDRIKAMEEFDSMPTEVKVKALEGMGYTTTVAAALAADQVKGQAAYIRGLEEQQLTMLSNDIASSQGITNHDTVFDNGHDMSYVESGQVNQDLTPTSQKVQTARQQLTTAKTNYDDSVTNANESIDKAKKAKDRYDRTLKNIKESSGDDPKKWTTEQIEEYNNAAKDYNEAIVDVNKAVSEVDSKKAVYEAEKDNYNAACEEYRQAAAEEYESSQEGNILFEGDLDNNSDANLIGDDVFIGAISESQNDVESGGTTITDVTNVSDNIELSDDEIPIVIYDDAVTYVDKKKED